MKDLSELFWESSLEEIKQGYAWDLEAAAYICLICGASFARGVVYELGGSLYEAEKGAEVHLQTAHGSMFEYLLELNKKFTGLTDLQKKLLSCFYRELSDRETADELGGGSTSTIRNHRFTFREKQRQAKIFLALMELLEQKMGRQNKFINIPRSASIIDERFAITEVEYEKMIKAYFKQGPEGPLSDFPTKEKRKVAVLRHIIGRFSLERKYSEKEINEVLKPVYHDYVMIRRYLVEYGLLDRHRDGSVYWVKT
jgi:hypothetical protein